MLSTAERARVTVVLVGARNPGNIGAAARAMHDFGFTDLRFVNDYIAPLEAAQIEAAKTEASKAAVAADHVLRDAQAFASVAEAVADCTLVVGTTAIGGRALEQRLLPLADAAPELLAAVRAGTAERGGRAAVLFGSEKTGLTREQLSHCNWLTTSPMFAPAGERHLSMNLGQSVAVCLYELVRGGMQGAAEFPVAHEASATAEDRERLTQLLLDVMHVTEYARRFPANAQEALVRQLAQSLGTDHARAGTWMGILRQVLWSGRKPR
jgi:TrmH family RNA methyltransferase